MIHLLPHVFVTMALLLSPATRPATAPSTRPVGDVVQHRLHEFFEPRTGEGVIRLGGEDGVTEVTMLVDVGLYGGESYRLSADVTFLPGTGDADSEASIEIVLTSDRTGVLDLDPVPIRPAPFIVSFTKARFAGEARRVSADLDLPPGADTMKIRIRLTKQAGGDVIVIDNMVIQEFTDS